MDALIKCDLPPSDFTHLAHLRLAWLRLNQDQLGKAVIAVQDDILRYVEFLGVKEKYNRTLTIAAVYIVHRRMESSDAADFHSFMTSNSDLASDFKNLIMRHYKTDIFTSENAKSEFLEPELSPF